MSSNLASPLVPVDLTRTDLPDAPAFPFGNLTRSSPYAQRLFDLELPTKALRAESERTQWRWYRDRSGSTWSEPAWNAMLRTMPHYAQQLAADQERVYAPIAELIHDSAQFTIAVVTIHVRPYDPYDAVDARSALVGARRRISAVRHLIQSSLRTGGSLTKIAWSTVSPTLKILHTGSLTIAEQNAFRSRLPSSTDVTFQLEPKRKFTRYLRKLAAPDLPTNPALRADFEFLLMSTHLLSVHNVTRAMRSKFVSPEEPYTNLHASVTPLGDPGDYRVEQTRIPANPRTGLLATHYTAPLPATMKLSDIPDTFWLPFPSWTAHAPPLRLPRRPN